MNSAATHPHVVPAPPVLRVRNRPHSGARLCAIPRPLQIAIVGLVALVSSGCGGETTPAAPPPVPVPVPVPEVLDTAAANRLETCRPCHLSEVQRWEAGGHSRSVRTASPTTVGAPLPGRADWAPPHDVEMAVTDGRVEMTTVWTDGKRRTFPVSHVVGGSKLDMYLTPIGDDGRPQVLPAMWSRREGQWVGYWEIDLKRDPVPPAPAHPRFWSERHRNFASYCNRCHSPRTRVDYDPDGGRYTIDWGASHDLGVGCAACHGDATAHVNDARAGRHPPARTRRDALPDPSTLGRVHACGRCHVSGEWVSLEDAVDTDFYDVFLPLVLDDTYHFWPDGRHRDHAYLFMNHVLSQCFRVGHARCESCHEVHGETASEARARSLAACNRCHPTVPAPCRTHPRGTEAAAVRDCIDCHMPELVIERGHGRAHDHRISVPDPTLTRELGIPNACSTCHADKDVAWAEATMAGWQVRPRPQRQHARAIAGGQAGDPAAVPALRALAADATASWVFRASAARALARHGDPETATLLARLATDAEHPMVRASAAYGLIGQPGDGVAPALAAALADPRRAVRVMAAAGVIVRAQTAEMDGAVAEIERVVAAIPDHQEMHLLLALGYERVGALDRARRAFDRAERLTPRLDAVRAARAAFEQRVAERPK